MAEYRLTPAAEQDLESIWTFTAHQWGVEQAARYLDVLTAAFDKLAELPQIAPGCEHIRSGYRRFGVERHVIYFRMSNDGMVIVRVLHARMDALRHL